MAVTAVLIAAAMILGQINAVFGGLHPPQHKRWLSSAPSWQDRLVS